MKSKTRMRVNENGRVVIPASFRKQLGIRVGDEAALQIQDDELRITTLKRNLERAQRLARKHVKPGTSLVDELIAERIEAVRHEQGCAGHFRLARHYQSGTRTRQVDP